MANNIFWVQNGGNQEENDQRGLCFFPKAPMVPLSCAEDYGVAPVDHCWHGPTAGHRGGGGTYANSRILDFVEPDYCRIHCLEDKPRKCVSTTRSCALSRG